MNHISSFYKKHKPLDNVIYGIFMIPTLFYVTLGLNSCDVTGFQEERSLELLLIYTIPPAKTQVILLSLLGGLSIILSYFSDFFKKNILKSGMNNCALSRAQSLSAFLSLSLQYFLLFSFCQSSFLVSDLKDLQKLELFAGVVYAIHSIKQV